MAEEADRPEVEEEERPSRSALDRAGRRIRHDVRDGNDPQERDRLLVDRFRAAHYPVVEAVQQALTSFFHGAVGLDQERAPITSRLKTPQAIIAKLCRSTTNLSTMQDIAGARIVLPEYVERNLEVQDVTFDLLQQETVFGGSWTVVRTKDQREPPDPTGYRPLHVIVLVDGLLAEIQIRTEHQDRWAQVVEALDSRGSWDLKHGSGPADLLAWLRRLSDALRQGDLGLSVEIPPIPGGERGEGGER